VDNAVGYQLDQQMPAWDVADGTVHGSIQRPGLRECRADRAHGCAPAAEGEARLRVNGPPRCLARREHVHCYLPLATRTGNLASCNRAHLQAQLSQVAGETRRMLVVDGLQTARVLRSAAPDAVRKGPHRLAWTASPDRLLAVFRPAKSSLRRVSGLLGSACTSASFAPQSSWRLAAARFLWAVL